MQTTINIPATLITDRDPPLDWPDFLAETGFATLDAQDLLRSVADVILGADHVLGIERETVAKALAQKWPEESVYLAIGQTLNYIGGISVYRLYDGRTVIVPPSLEPSREKKKEDLPPRATIEEVNETMAELNMTPAQLGRALGATTKHASKSVYDWLRGVSVPSRRTTEKLRALRAKK